MNFSLSHLYFPDTPHLNVIFYLYFSQETTCLENACLSVKVLGLERDFEGGKCSVHNAGTEKEGSVVCTMQRLRRREV